MIIIIIHYPKPHLSKNDKRGTEVETPEAYYNYKTNSDEYLLENPVQTNKDTSTIFSFE